MNMSNQRLLTWCVASLAMLLVTAASPAADWLTAAPDGSPGLKEASQATAPELTVVEHGDAGLSVVVETPGLLVTPTKTDAGSFVRVDWPWAPKHGVLGAPSLPVVRELIVAPTGATVSVSARPGAEVAYDGSGLGADLRILPVQAPIEKIPGAREAAPFYYDEAAYAIDAYGPAELATITYAGIMRGQELYLLEVHPVAYNPVQQQLVWYPEMKIDVQFTGGSGYDNSYSVLPGMENVVLNQQAMPAAQRAGGNYLLVIGDDFEAAMQPFVAAKQSQGFTVSQYIVPQGTPASTIRDYIVDLFGSPATAPDYVLLVGDTEYIGEFTGQGEGSPATDLPYSAVQGVDYLPDLALGRFPCSDSSELTAILNKTMYYEAGQLADPAYLKRAAFMASVDNYQISEGTHNYCIETYLEPNEYLVDRLYQVTYGADTEDVRQAFNDGRFYGIYSGHGSTTSWADGPPFSQSDVRGLTNENMYAFICSFACVTGSYHLDECFMETWMITPNKAAVCAWGSSVNSYWDEDDILERVLFDSIFDGEDDVPNEAGPLYTESKLRFFAHYGDSPTTRRYTEMYNLMGDPAVRLPSTCSDAGSVTLNRTKYACDSTADIQVVDCGLNLDDGVIDTVAITVFSDTDQVGEQITLFETDLASATFQGSVDLLLADVVGAVQISEGDTVTVHYVDADNGEGGYDVDVYAYATVDCTPPMISDVATLEVEPRSALVGFTADEPAQGTVRYGLSCDALDGIAPGSGYTESPIVEVTGLQDETTYFYAVEAADEAGNLSADDNGGACYTFTTPEVPDFFTEWFQEGDNDLDNLSLMFTPGDPVDFYRGCVVGEIDTLPTDPTTGTVLSLSDDDSESISLAGAQVWLYGVAYDSVYVCSNGYLTFGASDTEYDETYDDHFSLPRVSLLFNDFNPTAGGTITWEQFDNRLVVSYVELAEFNTNNSNTMQVELFFDGTIVISYLGLDATGGLAGLSEGEDTDPDFYESDLSNMFGCGPQPPRAISAEVQTPVNEPIALELAANDDGLPEPPQLDFIIVSLPANGTLYEDAVAIDSAPWILVDGGNLVTYEPAVNYAGPDAFTFKANDGGSPPEGGDSNVATIDIVVGGPQAVYSWPMDEDPNWAVEDAWAFGVPTGGGSHNLDPTAGFDGPNVYGFNLNGDYVDEMPVYALTTTAMDCTDVTGAELRFQRWLGVESSSYDHATIQGSTDGTTWVTIWDHSGGAISDAAWQAQALDVSDLADGAPTFYVRWLMGPTDTSVTYPGWNLDNVELWGVIPYAPGLNLVTSDPADGAIDACKPHDADNASNLYGWHRVTLIFDGAADSVDAADFTVDEIGGDGLAPDILAVMLLDTEIVEVLFTERIEPLAWTVLTYVPSGQTVTLGFLPGDTDQDGFAGTFDVLALIDHLNGAITLPGYYATDIDRSNETNSFDVLEVINLLNGAAEYDVYNEAQLP
jgi:hypothetical protein